MFLVNIVCSKIQVPLNVKTCINLTTKETGKVTSFGIYLVYIHYPLISLNVVKLVDCFLEKCPHCHSVGYWSLQAVDELLKMFPKNERPNIPYRVQIWNLTPGQNTFWDLFWSHFGLCISLLKNNIRSFLLRKQLLNCGKQTFLQYSSEFTLRTRGMLANSSINDQYLSICEQCKCL